MPGVYISIRPNFNDYSTLPPDKDLTYEGGRVMKGSLLFVVAEINSDVHHTRGVIIDFAQK